MMKDRPNVALLTVDALRADHLSCFGYDRQTTPALDILAASFTDFPETYSASTHTREAIPALLTGEYPDVCISDDYALAGDTIATLLAETAYTTGAFHSNPYVSRGYGFGTDFDEFYDDLYFGSHKLLALVQRAIDRVRQRHYAPAEEITDRSLSWLESVDGPFFLWNHYMDPHGPYDPPAEYARTYHGETTSTRRAQRLYRRAAVKDPDSITDDERREMIDLYDGEIRYVDAQIEAFLDGLQARGLLEETVVIVTADHGDAFGEHGYYGHPRQLDDELLHVPLIVRHPTASGETVESPTSTLDVVPTVLDIAGLDPEPFVGRSLLDGNDDNTDRRVFAQVRGMKDDSHLRRYCVRSRNERGWVEREIESGEITSGPDGALSEVVEAHSRRRHEVAMNGDHAGGDTPDADVERRLEALGYK